MTRLVAAGTERRLTVVCAPAGFGKTTALVEGLRATGRNAAWVSLDGRDNDPRRMWTHVVAALDRMLPGELDAAALALRGGSDLLDTVLPLTLNALAGDAGDGVVLVLDDYHRVTEPACAELLNAFLVAAPPGLRMVVASRTPLPFHLGRRRAAATVAEIGPGELAFEGAESELLLNGSLGLNLSRDELAFVDERVAGWAAGLSLVAASLAERPDREQFLAAFGRSRRTVAEYLSEEVLDATEPRMRHFLCRTSILPRLGAELCEAVLDDPAAAELLDEVRRSNLFVRVVDDDAAGWLRYHDLFADVLRGELHCREPELVSTLHRRASRWFEREGLMEDAIAHASAAGDGRRAARLVHDADLALLVDGSYASTRRMIDAIPPERGEFGPFCDALYTLSRQLDGAEPALVYERLEELRALGDAGGIRRIVDQARIWPFFGRIEATVKEGWTAYERYRDEPPAIRHSIAAHLGLTLWFAGERARAREVIERHLDAMIFLNSKSWALAALAFCAVEQHDGVAAERYAREAVTLARRAGGETALQYAIAYQALGETRRFQGRHDDAAQTLGHADQVTAKLPGSLHHALTLLLRAQLELTRHDRRSSRRAAAGARAIIDRFPDAGILGGRLAAIEAALEGRANDALLGTRPTRAEQRLLEFLAGGLTLEAIARERLYLSMNTVASHRRRLYRRLGVSTREDAVAVARERGLL